MATIAVVSDGQVRSVYDDKFRPILESIGAIQVERATEVEFDAASGDWIATLIETGDVIARGKNRGDCIKREVEFLESRM